ncbi:hypothetical protein [Acaryochloris thomasi]|uniref:hypothetical protein n=1 Tax=Acaryochloris thomasi TaxID=2929456 RepID=UPI000DA66EE3|nr:hypothetical protein [Acaryochloris thomasi]
MTRFLSIAAPAGRCFQVMGACAFASALGLLVTNPFKEAAGISSSCSIEPTPATLIVSNQTSPACTIALSASE